MKPKTIKEGRYIKTFSKNRLLRLTQSVIKELDGSDEEKLGQFELFFKSDKFQKRFPGLVGKDVATLVRLQLG